MNRFLLGCMTGALAICLSGPIALADNPPSATQKSFGEALRKFGLDHNRLSLRQACDQASAAEPRYALPVFYRGVLDEADEDWSAAELDFRGFLVLENDTDLSAKARRELEKLPGLIREDSTPSGKLNRHYRQHLAYADFLQKRGFAKEALLEAGEAVQLAPARWEAYAVASAVLLSQHQVSQASHFLEMARQRTPSSANGKLTSLQAMIATASGTTVQVPISKGGPGGKRPQAKTQAEFDAYQAAAANVKDPAAMEKAADDFAAKFPESESRISLYRLTLNDFQSASNAEKTSEFARKVLVLDPDDPGALLGMALVLVYQAQGTDGERLTEARKDAQRALVTVDTDVPTWAYSAEQLDAVKGYLRAEAYAILGGIDLGAKAWADAEGNFRKSIDAYPQPYPLVIFRLAVALDMQNKYPEASKFADRAVDLTKTGTDLGDKARQEKDRLMQLSSGGKAAQPGPASTGKNQNPAPPRGKVIQDPAEYSSYMHAVQQQDAAAKVSGLEAFLTQYPNSVMKEVALEILMDVFQQAGIPSKTCELAQRILRANPNNVRALAALAFDARSHLDIGKENQGAVADAAQYGNRGLQALLLATKPENLSDADFVEFKKKAAAIFNGASGFAALQNKDYVHAQQYLRAAVQTDPNDFRNVYPLALAYLTATVPDSVNGLFFIARATNLANGEGKSQLEAYGKIQYTYYHGSEQGWSELLATAKNLSEPQQGLTAHP
jgi:tetratricopeptide (TPR) repeat protein